MGTIVSLLLYNPLEAFIFIYLLNPKPTKMFVIKHSYILGTLLYLLQTFCIYLFADSFNFIVYLYSFILTPIVIKLYVKHILKLDDRFIISLFLLYSIITIFLVYIFGLNISTNKDFWHEFIFNIILKIITITILIGGMKNAKKYVRFTK